MSDELFCGLTEDTVEQYTPEVAAAEVIIRLRILVEITQGYGTGAFDQRFGKHFLESRPKLSDPDTFEAQKPVFTNQSPELWARERNSFYICTAAIFAFDAIDEYRSGRIQHAWVLATEAKTFMGLACGSDSAIVMPRIFKSDQARKNAYKARKEDIASRKIALDYYQEHIDEFESIADAARQMTQKTIVRETLKIVERWIYAFHKENPTVLRPSNKKITCAGCLS